MMEPKFNYGNEVMCDGRKVVVISSWPTIHHSPGTPHYWTSTTWKYTVTWSGQVWSVPEAALSAPPPLPPTDAEQLAELRAALEPFGYLFTSVIDAPCVDHSGAGPMIGAYRDVAKLMGWL